MKLYVCEYIKNTRARWHGQCPKKAQEKCALAWGTRKEHTKNHGDDFYAKIPDNCTYSKAKKYGVVLMYRKET